MEKLSDVMHGIITVDENEYLAVAAIKMISNHRGSVIITNKKGTNIGILTERDMLRIIADGFDPKVTLIRGHYTKNPITIDENKTLDEALKIMEANKFRRLPVTRNGEIIGIVSLRSLLKHLRYGLAQKFFAETFHPGLTAEIEGRNYR